MIKKLARWILRRQLTQMREENRRMYRQVQESADRWIETNRIMSNRAQQERLAVTVRQGKKYLPVLAVKTNPGSSWEVLVGK